MRLTKAKWIPVSIARRGYDEVDVLVSLLAHRFSYLYRIGVLNEAANTVTSHNPCMCERSCHGFSCGFKGTRVSSERYHTLAASYEIVRRDCESFPITQKRDEEFVTILFW